MSWFGAVLIVATAARRNLIPSVILSPAISPVHIVVQSVVMMPGVGSI